MHPFIELKIENKPSSFLLTPCPGTKEVSLTDSLKQLKKAGAKAVLSLMLAEEMEKFGVADISEKCKELGLEWFHLPIEDDHAPEEAFSVAWDKNRNRILELLEQQGAVAIHCRGGTGRTGLIAAQLLIETGMPLKEAVEAVQTCKPRSLTLPVHTDYIEKFAAK